MANDTTAGQWERVASELRACREAQRRAYGDVDPLTLGRYLSDEASGDERRQVEQALEAHPDLRLLTDLVRDVLGEAETSSEPAILPLRPRQAPPRNRLRS